MNSNIAETFFKTAGTLPTALQKLTAALASFALKTWLCVFPKPRRLIFFVTNQCNKNCDHCFCRSTLNSKNNSDLTLAQIKNMIANFPKHLLQINLTGGEPFMRNDLEEIVAHFAANNRPKGMTINTNAEEGKKTAARIESMLAGNKIPLSINVSINSASQLLPSTPQTELLTQLIEHKKNFTNFERVCILTSISKQNFDQVKNIIKTARTKFKGCHLLLQFVRSASQVKTGSPTVKINAEMVPENYELLALCGKEKTAIIELYQNTATSFEEKQQLELLKMSEQTTCMAPFCDTLVLNNGWAGFCEQLQPVIDLKTINMDINKFWNAQKTKSLRKTLRTCWCQHPCYLQITSVTSRKALTNMIKTHSKK